MSLLRQRLDRFARFLADERSLWEGRIPPETERRTYAQIWDDEYLNAWLIRWHAGHDTGWHDHDDSAASIVVLRGQVLDERLRLIGAPSSRLFIPDQTFHVPPTAIHRVRHAGDAPALTLHCYSPPLRRTGAYSVDPEGELQRLSQPYEEELRAEAAVA